MHPMEIFCEICVDASNETARTRTRAREYRVHPRAVSWCARAAACRVEKVLGHAMSSVSVVRSPGA